MQDRIPNDKELCVEFGQVYVLFTQSVYFAVYFSGLF